MNTMPGMKRERRRGDLARKIATPKLKASGGWPKGLYESYR
jgi:hypothetical protein